MPRDKVTYEWHIECCDEHGDANNVDFGDTFAEALALQASWAGTGDYAAVKVALVRTEGNEIDGIGDRYYAYLLPDGSLETVFSTFHDPEDEGGAAEDGPDVPQRFLKEVHAVRAEQVAS